jgi:hypothetical protein
MAAAIGQVAGIGQKEIAGKLIWRLSSLAPLGSTPSAANAPA